MKKIFLLFAISSFLYTGIGYASNITISDNNFTTSDWYGNHEDGEVEPGMQKGQIWDLEGFFLEGKQLSLVGGYDFKNGQGIFYSGDIFIDTGGDAVYGDIDGSSNGNRSVTNSYGYDYVLDLNWDQLTYDVYAIDQDTNVLTAYYAQNQGSSPWRYESGGTLISGGLELGYIADVPGYDDMFNGDWHNELIVSLDFLPAHTDFITHYTMGCGNDNIMGQATIPNPEPATMLLLGFGLIGIAGLGRRKLSK